MVAGKARWLKPGRYVFQDEVSAAEVLEILTVGPKDVAATIVPGATLLEIDEQLNSLGIIKAGDIVNFDVAGLKEEHLWLGLIGSLEGFLLPDTYFFQWTATPKTLLIKC